MFSGTTGSGSDRDVERGHRHPRISPRTHNAGREPKANTFALIIVMAWMWTGFAMVMIRQPKG